MQVYRGKTISRRAQYGSQTDTHLALDAVGPLLKVLENCVSDLRETWNILDDETRGRRLAKRASGSLEGVFKPKDYPSQAMRKGSEGGVALALLIDETGRVADCTIIETSGVAVLDAQSCAIVMDRARLQPAIGTDGERARDAFLQRIRWRIAR